MQAIIDMVKNYITKFVEQNITMKQENSYGYFLCVKTIVV